MPDRTPPAWAALRSWARRRFHLHLVVAVLAVVVSIVVLTVFFATRERDLPEGTPATTTVALATPTVAAPASPEAATAYPPGSLPALLALAPDWLGADAGLPVRATYADIAGWLEARGIDAATADDATLRQAIAPLALPEPLRENGLSAQWRADYGFDLGQVDAVLAVGQAPNVVLIMPGRYDVDALYATWVANGYQAVAVEEMTVWSLAPGDRIDLSAPASQPSLGLLNTVVALDDGTLVATSRQSLMADTLRVIGGRSRSLAGHAGLRAALPRSVDAMSAILADGSLLERPVGARAPAATPAGEATAALPPVDLVLFTLPAHPEESAVRMTLIYDDPPDDPATLRRVVASRTAADAAWSSRHRVEAVRIAGAGHLVEITISGGDNAGLQIADPLALAPFRWSPAG
jgi:hypothetical protein